MKMPTGIQLIKAERRRQISEEKWTAKHDAERHADGDLSTAAFCYERVANFQETCGDLPEAITVAFKLEPRDWPWEPQWFKLGGSAIRTYVKAGALFQAEIDRILKLFSKPAAPKDSQNVRQLVVARTAVIRIACGLDRLLK